MKATGWIIIIIVVIFLGGLFLVMKNRDTGEVMAPDETTEPAQNNSGSTTGGAANVSENIRNEDGVYVVAYTAQGFNPSEIQVRAGDEVRFENQHTLAMQVVGTEYQNGKKLANFDAPKALGNGEAYTFTFTEAGIWAFKNSLEETHVGTIVVFPQ